VQHNSIVHAIHNIIYFALTKQLSAKL